MDRARCARCLFDRTRTAPCGEPLGTSQDDPGTADRRTNDLAVLLPHARVPPLSDLVRIVNPFFVVAWLAREQPVVVAVMIGPGLLLALLGLAFHHLTVEDEGDRLAIRFGPLPFLETSIRYADIQRVEVGRTMILDGWGIHRSPRHGWVWNLWDRDCVVIHRQRGVLRVGSDDAENLAGFLKGKMGAV